MCHACQPGGPQQPPPCRRCGRSDDFYSAGVCLHCHRDAPRPIRSCPDCYAWGTARIRKGLCAACCTWRAGAHHHGGICAGCSTDRKLDNQSLCRLCCRQLRSLRHTYGRHTTASKLAESGQQLMFAGMHKVAAGAIQPRPVRARWPDRPVAHRQLVLFDNTPDLSKGRTVLGPPRDLILAAALDVHITDVASRLDWTYQYTSGVRGAIRLLLSLQHTPGAPITGTEIDVLHQLSLPARAVRELLDEVGMLDDDRVPAVRTWFASRVADLPETLRNELGTWFEIMHTGSTSSPRRQPRNHVTIRLYTVWALPAITRWAADGHRSLREISKADVLDVLPASGRDRAETARALGSIFTILKARRHVFVNPAAGIRAWVPSSLIPMPADLTTAVAGLQSTNPARAAILALVLFHGLSTTEIRQLQLGDIRDRHLHLNARRIPLAELARERVAAYLAYRNQRWPNTLNSHLFLNFRTRARTDSVGYRWLRLTVDYPGGIRALRQDRILHEATATNGDARRLTDLFGLSINAALRYTDTIAHPDLQ